MGTVAPALPVVSVLARTQSLLDQSVAAITASFGPAAYVSAIVPFEHTAYYCGELGDSPLRRFVALDQLARDPACLPALKRSAGRLEIALGGPLGGRQVNIDPGLLNPDQLVVASTKPRRHRIYLDQGIYGDLMLLFDGATYVPLPWTYPDYAEQELCDLFTRLRTLCLCDERVRRLAETACVP